MTLSIENLHVSVDDKEILKGLTVKIEQGEIHALMGPNGSGKSTLAHVLMGNPKYKVTSGKIMIDHEDITHLSPDARAKKGLFLSFQHPVEIPGVSVESFLRMAYNQAKGKTLNVLDFHKLLKEHMERLKVDPAFAKRYLNEGFSGGEKKRMEILQMSILDPKYIILDETDSGLDIDALNTVAEGINRMQGRAILIITHFTRLLKLVEPDHVHILQHGQITRSDGKQLAHEIEQKGYQ